MASGQSDTQFTLLLHRWAEGDADAREALVQSAFQQLRQIARAQLAGERAGHTLQPTALVNEAYLKLSGGQRIEWRDRVHFFAVCARVIRQVLIDYGRRRGAARRDHRAVTLKTNLQEEQDDVVDLLQLDQALERLEAMEPLQARVVELRYFAGLTIEETAAAMDLSTATVDRYWRAARAWLYQYLGEPT